MANYYLLKTEPSEYSFAELQKDKKPVWDGVSNPATDRGYRARATTRVRSSAWMPFENCWTAALIPLSRAAAVA